MINDMFIVPAPYLSSFSGEGLIIGAKDLISGAKTG
jgi:hypothetical protein